jgi:uncharacterized protein YjbI with pentapeptide repeats
VGLDVLAPQSASPAPDRAEVAPASEATASVESRASLQPIPSPEPAAAQPRKLGSGLPDFAEKADDLESIRKAVDDAATVGGALWFSYLFVLFYLAVAAGAVTHADLFLENPVKLPFLNIDLPFLAFFALAPILFLFTHGYTLVHLVMLTEKAKDYDQALREQIVGDKLTRDKLRRQLPSNVFIQYLAAPSRVRKSPFGYALGFIAWTTLAVAPVFLLLLFQMQFLPFHSSFITWIQRVVLVLDLALIWWLWGTIRSGREIGASRGLAFWTGRILGLAISFALTVGVILFSVAVATFPGEWQEAHLRSAKILPKIELASRLNDQSQKGQSESLWDWVKTSWNWVKTSEKVSLHDWIFDSPLDDITRRRLFPFSNTLVLIGFNVPDGIHIDGPKKGTEPEPNVAKDLLIDDWTRANERDFVFRARGRDLKGARFDYSILPKIDFTGADLEGASFYEGQLDRTSFEWANLRGSTLSRSQLNGAFFNWAQLESASLDQGRLSGASLFQARLQGASLNGAQLPGAFLAGTHLQGGSLVGAKLQGALLGGAGLQGASLKGAELQGATLEGAELEGALLDGAQLQGASLNHADLGGASFDSAQLQGARFDNADLHAADFSRAFLWRAGGLSFSLGNDLRLEAPIWGPFYRSSQDPWTDAIYQDLRKTIIEAIPAFLRDLTLDRIRILDCANPDKALAPCDPAAPLPPESKFWRADLERSAASGAAFSKAVAETLKSTICDSDDDAIFILRGLLQDPAPTNRLRATGSEAPQLIAHIMSPACPVSAKLTEKDKARLLEIKRYAIE